MSNGFEKDCRRRRRLAVYGIKEIKHLSDCGSTTARRSVVRPILPATIKRTFYRNLCMANDMSKLVV
jgi:hypothetical protein